MTPNTQTDTGADVRNVIDVVTRRSPARAITLTAVLGVVAASGFAAARPFIATGGRGTAHFCTETCRPPRNQTPTAAAALRMGLQELAATHRALLPRVLENNNTREARRHDEQHRD
jgi:hypothetical protein